MLTYLIRRLLLLIPTLIGMTVLVFGVMAAAPGGIGGPSLTDSGASRTGASAERLREYYEVRYGIDKPYVVQYLRWLNNISPIGFRAYAADDPEVVEARARANAAPSVNGKQPKPAIRAGDVRFDRPAIKVPDFGESMVQKRHVTDILIETAPVTLLLNALSIPMVYAAGIWTGIRAARARGQALDVAIGTSQLSMWSIPSIWAGVLLIGFLANKEYVYLFPTGGLSDAVSNYSTFLPSFNDDGSWNRGYFLDRLWHLVLPVACLSYGGSAFISKLTRGSVLENLSADFVRTARAKGVGENAILFRHVLSNSLLSLITVAASILPALLGGAIVIESIFGIPGMGKLAVEAVSQRDREVTLALTFIGGLIGLLSGVLRDVLYALADPRVTYD